MYKAQFHSQYFSFYCKSMHAYKESWNSSVVLVMNNIWVWWTDLIDKFIDAHSKYQRSAMIVRPMCSTRICLLLYNCFPWTDNSKLQSINQIWGFQHDRGLWVLPSRTFPDYIASVSLFIACEPDDIKISDETVVVTVDWSCRMAGRWDLALHSRPSLSLFLVFRLYLLLYLLPIYLHLHNKATDLIVIAWNLTNDM